MNAVSVRGLKKVYGSLAAVDDLSLEIREGECFALLGVNGAGKTTTIKMLSGLTKPTAGDALLLGKSIVSQPEQVKPMLGVSPQETAIAQNLSVLENLEFMAAVYGAEKPKVKARDMLKLLGLTPVEKQKAKTLSGGWQRRLSIALGLIGDPKILFLDEPTLGLDVLARRELWQVIERLRGTVTVILTTHYLEEAEALSDRIGIMAAGRLCAVGTVQELLAETGTNKLEDAFVALAQGGGNR